jgi:Zn-dependent protease
VGNFTMGNLILALEMLLGLFLGMTLREYVRARVGARLGDPTPRLWGRASLAPSRWFEPFGSGLVPGLIAILWAAGVLLIPAAYAKPAAVDAAYLRRQPRDTVVVSLAGPVTNLATAFVSGIVVRMGIGGEVGRAAAVVALANCALVVFHLLPVPGLDGARIVALLLPANVRDTYRNFDRYLPLMVLVILFLLGGITLAILDSLARALCGLAIGTTC